MQWVDESFTLSESVALPPKRPPVAPDFRSFAGNFNLLLVTMFSMLILMGTKHFLIWPQMDAVLSSNPIDLLLEHRVAGLQYLVIAPSLSIAKLLHLNWDQAFSFYVLGCIYAMSAVLGRACSTLMKLPIHNPFFTTCFLLFWLPASMFINGRLIFAFFGISLILFAQLRYLRPAPEEEHPLWLLLARQMFGLLLCSVSSGVFTLAFFLVETFTVGETVLDYLRKRGSALRLIGLNVALLLFYLPFNPIHVGPAYDPGQSDATSAADILLHGPYGMVATASPEHQHALIGGIFFGSCLVTLINLIRYLRKDSIAAPLVPALGLAIAFGLFGDFTFLMILPAFGLLLLSFLARPFTSKKPNI